MRYIPRNYCGLLWNWKTESWNILHGLGDYGIGFATLQSFPKLKTTGSLGKESCRGQQNRSLSKLVKLVNITPIIWGIGDKPPKNTTGGHHTRPPGHIRSHQLRPLPCLWLGHRASESQPSSHLNSSGLRTSHVSWPQSQRCSPENLQSRLQLILPIIWIDVCWFKFPY